MTTTRSMTVALAAFLCYLLSTLAAYAEGPTPANVPASSPYSSDAHEIVPSPLAADATLLARAYLPPEPEPSTALFATTSGDRMMVCKNDDDPEPATAAAEKEWPWRRAGIADYVSVVVLAGGTLYFEDKNGKPGKAKWTARNGFDEGIRDNMRLGSRGGRDAAHLASNYLMGVMIAAPVIETGAVLGLRDSKWDAVWQTEMVNIESFTFTSLVSSLSQNLIARERPFARNCTNGDCEGVQKNRSMPSGHVAFAFTGAGLLCTHHKYQDFYGDEATDSAICASGLAVSVADGVLRILSDRHYATDVIAGTAIGLFSGFVLPRILTYPWHTPSPDQKVRKEEPLIKNIVLAPEIYRDGGGVNCAFRF